MFRLDSIVFTLLYNQCRNLGNSLGFGAFEGAVIYFSILTLAVFKGLNINNTKKVVKK